MSSTEIKKQLQQLQHLFTEKEFEDAHTLLTLGLNSDDNEIKKIALSELKDLLEKVVQRNRKPIQKQKIPVSYKHSLYGHELETHLAKRISVSVPYMIYWHHEHIEVIPRWRIIQYKERKDDGGIQP
jgi:hypothetical protein